MITRRFLRPFGKSTPSQWVCPSCARKSIFPQSQKRFIQSVPPLAHDESFTADGVPDLFSDGGYSLAWTQYQGMLISKLNELTAGEAIENQSAKNLAIIFARDPMNAALFNYASAAHNNHHFFSTLSPKPVKLDNVPQLQQSLIRGFGSIENLRMTMLDTAAAMFGPGYVWLVWARNTDPSSAISAQRNSTSTFGRDNGSWRILTTYLAGTPYSEAGYRQQGLDTNTGNPASYQSYLDSQRLQPANTAGSFGPFSAAGREAARYPPGGTSVMPVLCVSTWEHTWIYDYGIPGKRQFLDRWWNVVDWGVVEHNAPKEARQVHEFLRE